MPAPKMTSIQLRLPFPEVTEKTLETMQSMYQQLVSSVEYVFGEYDHVKDLKKYAEKYHNAIMDGKRESRTIIEDEIIDLWFEAEANVNIVWARYKSALALEYCRTYSRYMTTKVDA